MRAAIGFALALLVGGVASADRPGFDPETIYKVPLGHSPVTGPAAAPVTVVAFSDYACGYCNRAQATLDRLSRLYPGLLRWVHRTLPLDRDNTLAAEAALAAHAQGGFLPMNDRLFGVYGRVDRASAELLARELGLDMVRFRADLDSHVYRDEILADEADAHALGVSGTPTFFINGRAINGDRNLKTFVERVEQELARAAEHPGGYDALVAGGKLAADTPPPPPSERPPAFDPSQLYRVGLGLPGHQAGPDSAAVTIVEWSDFQCPFCAKEAPVLAHVREKYGNDVRVVYRHMAMDMHPHAALAAEAAVAAAMQGKFWPFHDQIFAHFGHLERADLVQFAQAAGLDLVAFRAALDDRRYHDAVVAEGASAQALGVDGTPTMFINGNAIGGARDAKTIDRVIDAVLDRTRAAVAAGVAPGDIYALIMTASKGEERADPSRIPSAAAIHIEMRGEDRARAVAAACRMHDAARAGQLAGPLPAEPKRRAQQVCAGVGIDL
ncbi:MAG TPA: thioredoxin domain-containing protein [Kofleriaceae bacterium]